MPDIVSVHTLKRLFILLTYINDQTGFGMKFNYLKTITLISIIFSVYSSADEISKPAYVHIAFEFTGGGSYLINLMETNKKECNSVMKQLFKEYSAACLGCKPIKQECISALPSEYEGVFEKKKIRHI